MSVLGVFDRRFRGFRVIEIGGVGVLLALILLVYLAKTIAGSESAQIDSVQQQIADERNRVSLLRAEVASLEQPERLEALSSRYLGLQPVDAKHDIDPAALASIAGAPAPKPTPGSAPQAAAPAAAAPTVAIAAPPDAAKPAKATKLAAAAPRPDEASLAAEPAPTRPSELKAPAGESLGALVQAQPDAPADAGR